MVFVMYSTIELFLMVWKDRKDNGIYNEYGRIGQDYKSIQSIILYYGTRYSIMVLLNNDGKLGHD